MHMSDALITPVVGGVLWAGTAATTGYSVRKLSRDDLIEGKKIPLMGVIGAFVFAAQMINFTIPGTGSSGHIGGGLLLAAMLGPQAGFLTLMAVLAIQGLFFADGGLLAMGCNIINIGFFSCYVAYPLIFRPMLRKGVSPGRLTTSSILASVLGLQLGAFAVVLETVLSGRTELPFGPFALAMQPIHLVIGAVEGLITAAVLVFLHRVQPEAITGLPDSRPAGSGFPKKAVAVIAVLALVVGGGLGWFASANPDGLEWSMIRVAGTAELKASGSVHDAVGSVQEATALLPDYGFKASGNTHEAATEASLPAVNTGTSVAGIVGSAVTLALAGLIGLLLFLLKRRQRIQH